MGFLMPKSPSPPNLPTPPPAAHPAILGSNQLALATQGSKAGAAAASGMGFDNTIKTSQQGLTAPETAKTTLLGG
jgi:hypothetical protein